MRAPLVLSALSYKLRRPRSITLKGDFGPFTSRDEGEEAGFLDRFDALLHFELLKYPRDVGLHRVGRDAERAGHLLVRPARGKHRQYLAFAWREAERADRTVVAREGRGPRRRRQPPAQPDADGDEAQREQGDVEF